MLSKVSECAGLLIPIAMMLRSAAGGAVPHPNRITILYDAFGRRSGTRSPSLAWMVGPGAPRSQGRVATRGPRHILFRWRRRRRSRLAFF